MKKYDLAQQYAETCWDDEAYDKAEEKGFVFTIREQKEMSKADFIAGYNAAMEEWRKCYLSCSSPYCAAHFRTVKRHTRKHGENRNKGDLKKCPFPICKQDLEIFKAASFAGLFHLTKMTI